MATFLLVRHGLNDMVGKKLAGRLPKVHLNEQGHTQAQQLAEQLNNLPIKAIISSPLERTCQTAQPLSHILGLPVEINAGLQEIDFGTWEGRAIHQLKKLKAWAQVQDRPSTFCFPNGESFAEAQLRVVTALNEINGAYAEKDLVLCVSHCDLIKLAVAFYLNMPLDSFQKLQIDPVSVTVIYFQASKITFGPINASINFKLF